MSKLQVSGSTPRRRRWSYCSVSGFVSAALLLSCHRSQNEERPKAESTPAVSIANAKPAPELLPLGSALPDISAPTQTGAPLHLPDLRGKPVVVYFYPKDDTPGCTAEARELSALTPQFTELGAVVVGVSNDDGASHQAFASKYSLPFTLLADTDYHVAEAFHVPPLANGHASRTTFLFGRDGRLARVFPNVNPRGHGQELLNAIKALPGA
jgi:peroxiredoxin Q/BCP